MKYASTDIETLGLDPVENDMIEFGAVLDDLQDQKPLEELPRFHAYILPPGIAKNYVCDPFAASMHSTILRRIATRETGYTYLRPEELGERFATFLQANGLGSIFDKTKPALTCAGKNFASFDLSFLKKVGFTERVRLAHRCFDPGSLYFRPGDVEIPNTKTCCERAGVKGDGGHTSIADALVVVQLVRNAVNKFSLAAAATAPGVSC